MAELRKQLVLDAGTLKIYLVDGAAVRRDIDIDYVAGGHDLRYEYIPDGEVWIDDSQSNEDVAAVMLHELHERFRMALDITYEDAHNESSELEKQYRKDPEGIDDRILTEVMNNINIGMNRLSTAIKILEQ